MGIQFPCAGSPLGAIRCVHPGLATIPSVSSPPIRGIAPGIVVGRLQHEGQLPWNHLNHLKLRLEWTV